MFEEQKDKKDKDKTKFEAQDNLDKKLKQLGIVGVVYDEKNRMVVGVSENGTPKVIDQGEAFVILKNLSVVAPNRNDYAVGDDANKNVEPARVDETKIKEAEKKAEEQAKADETNKRVEKARERAEEVKNQSNAMEDAWSLFCGGKKLDKDAKRGVMTPIASELFKKVAKRAAKNAGKSLVKNMEKAGKVAAKGIKAVAGRI